MFLYWFFKIGGTLLFKIFFLMKIKGRFYLPDKGGYIIASNHLSFLDPIVLGVVCPEPLNFMARHDLFKTGFFRWLISSVGAFPVRKDGADVAGMRSAISRLRQGKVLLVFPEGTRSQDGRISEGQTGIAFLAAKAKVKVIPAIIRGTDKALGRKARFIRPWPISVTFGPALDPAEVLPDNPDRQDYRNFTDLIMNHLRRL